MLKEIDDLAVELDGLYQQALDRLEQQATDVLAIDEEIKKVLQRSADHESILQWDPERAMPPHTAFRSLALQIIRRATDLVPAENPLLESHYYDLLAWPEDPARNERTLRDQIAARIAYARQQSLSEFWARLQTRIVPTANPGESRRRALDEFVLNIGQPVPEAILVPTLFGHSSYTLCLALHRAKGEMEFVISPKHLQQIYAVGHALATLLLIAGRHKPANSISEALSACSNRVRGNFGLYAHRDHFPAGSEMSIRLHKDHVQFIVSPELYQLLQNAIALPYPNVQFVDAAMSDLVL